MIPILPISSPAIVLRIQEPEVVALTEAQKKIVERIKAMGFTLKSQKRGKNSVGAYIRLEWTATDGRIVELSFHEASGTFGAANTVCSVKIILELPTDKAQARGAAAAKGFPEYSVLVLPALGQPGKSEVHFTSYEETHRESDTVIPAQFQQIWEIAKACSLGSSVAAPEKPVPAMEKTLKATGRPYTDAGDAYAITFKYSENRSQVVYLRKTAQILGVLKLHEAYSKFYEAPTPLEPERMKKLFETELSYGGLSVTRPEKNKGAWSVRYKVDIPADCTPAVLDAYLLLAAGTADNFEKDLSPKNRL